MSNHAGKSLNRKEVLHFFGHMEIKIFHMSKRLYNSTNFQKISENSLCYPK